MNTLFRFVFCLGCAGFLGSCGGGKEKFYRLSAADAAATGGSSSGLSVAVGPVSLPSYLDRAELVFASGPNEFQVPSNALWIGSLQENISRTMAADLGATLGSRNVRSSLGVGFKPRYRVALDVKQFHGISGQEAILDLSWRVQSGAGGQTISRQSGSFRERIVGDGYAAVVRAESALLDQAAHAIAGSLRGR